MMATHLRALDLPIDHHLDVVLLIRRKVHLWRLASKVQYAQEVRMFGGAVADEAHAVTAGLKREAYTSVYPQRCRVGAPR